MATKKKVVVPEKKQKSTATSAREKGVNLDRLKRFAKSFGPGAGDRAEWLSLTPPEEAHIRVLPPVHGNDLFVEEHWTHQNRYNPRGTFAAVLDDGQVIYRMPTCLRLHADSDCPICEITDWMEENDMDDEVQKLSARARYLMNVWSFSDDKVLMWGASAGAWGQLRARIEAMEKTNPKYMDISHLVTGEDLLVKAVRSNNPRFPLKYEVQPIERKPFKIQGWEEKTHDLKAYIRIPSYDEVLQIIVDNLSTVLPLGDIFGKKKLPSARPLVQPKRGKARG